MDFKSHEEFVLLSEEAKKKRAREAAGERCAAPQTRESPPEERKQVTAPPTNEGPAPADVKDRTDSISALCDRIDTLIEVVTASNQEIGELQNQTEVLRGQLRRTEESLEGVNSLVRQIALTLAGLVELDANPDLGESQESSTVD